METDSEVWAQQQWGECQLGDRRRTRRAVQLGAAMARQPEASLPAQGGWSQCVAWRLPLAQQPAGERGEMWQPHLAQTRQAASQQALVLLVQDRTTLDYSHHPATQGLGPVGSRYQRRYFLHSVLAVLPNQQVLGLAHGQVMVRPEHPPPAPKRQRRGSLQGQAWEAAILAIGAPPAGSQWIHVSDREKRYFRVFAS